MPAKTYTSIPTDIEALQWDGTEERAQELREFTSGQEGFKYREAFYPSTHHIYGTLVTARLWVAANHEWLGLETGEWVAKDAHGCYPIKDDVFQRKYREKHV